MLLNNNRKICICAAGNRKATKWAEQSLMLSDFYEKLAAPSRGSETLSEYMGMKKQQQDDLKDVGGYVAGKLKDGKRKASAVINREIITLDCDHIPPGETDNILKRVEGLTCGYCVYSTRKHAPEAPRLRILLPLDRPVTADEYEPIARKTAEFLGLELCDPTTFEASRMMYWPSCCADSVYVYQVGDKPFLSANGILGLYSDWKDCRQWPQVPGLSQSHIKLAARQGDPTEKQGLIGAFCRVYSVYDVMDKFLPGVYETADMGEDRFTYTGGSTTGGAVVYDEGKFIFSHHATDPAGGRLCNAWDLVRLHKFADLDEDAAVGTPPNRLPSFRAMGELASQDDTVVTLLNNEKYNQAVKDFQDIDEVTPDDGKWRGRIKTNSEGRILKTMDNIWLILENDPLLKGKLAYNEFACKGQVLGALPWNKDPDKRDWADTDDSGIQWYLEKTYDITGRDKIAGSVSLCAHKQSFDEVKDYLNGLVWDGLPRLDTLFIDYLGAADTPYTRAVTRKAFTAAVARAMKPGTKFDIMTILTGKQGIGKSTLLKKMGRNWFSDSIKTFEGKEASELVQGVWLVEIGELGAFNKSEIERVKQFLSQSEDIFRAAYARHVQWYPRRCVFFGTSNNREYLRDKTGNRRFWPVDLGVQTPTKSVFANLDDEVDQLWAEAKEYWEQGEPLFLDSEMEKIAKEEQEAHREQSVREGLIHDFLSKPIPKDWQKWDYLQRLAFWSGSEQGDLELVERDRVCALEVWCEALGGDKKNMRQSDTKEINNILERFPDWERLKSSGRFGYCGTQRGFYRLK